MKWYWVRAYLNTSQEPRGKSNRHWVYLLKHLQFSKASWTHKLGSGNQDVNKKIPRSDWNPASRTIVFAVISVSRLIILPVGFQK